MKMMLIVFAISFFQVCCAQDIDEFVRGRNLLKDVDEIEHVGEAKHYEFDMEWDRKSDDRRLRIASELEKNDRKYILVSRGSSKFQLIIIAAGKPRLFDDFASISPLSRLVDVVVMDDGSYFVLYSSHHGFEVRKIAFDSGKAVLVMSAFILIDPTWRKSNYNKTSPLITQVQAGKDGTFTISFDKGEAMKYSFLKGDKDVKCNGKPHYGNVTWYP